MKVTIGGEAVYDFGGSTNNAFALTPGPRVVCRWASTHFNHATEVVIEAEAKCELYSNGDPNVTET